AERRSAGRAERAWDSSGVRWRSRTTGSAAPRRPAIGRRAIHAPTKVARRIDFGRCSRAAAPPTLDVVTARSLLSGLLVVPGEDEEPPRARPARRLGRRQLDVPARGRGRRPGSGGPGRPRAGWAAARLRCDRWGGARPRPLVAAALAVRPRSGLGADRGLLVRRGPGRPDRPVHRRRLPPLAACAPGRGTAARRGSGP